MKIYKSSWVVSLSSFILHPSSLLSARRRKASNASFDLVGRAAMVERTLAPEGAILVDGEMWRACAHNSENIKHGACVRVVGARGYLLEVARIECNDED